MTALNFKSTEFSAKNERKLTKTYFLRGDMSFVGPRPERAYFYGEFEKYIPGFSNRLMVVPGLTGHAQVNGGYSLKPEEKIIYDMEYIEKRSIWMDLACIGKTIRVVLCGAGAR